jgi:hypothetical protein
VSFIIPSAHGTITEYSRIHFTTLFDPGIIDGNFFALLNISEGYVMVLIHKQRKIGTTGVIETTEGAIPYFREMGGT